MRFSLLCVVSTAALAAATTRCQDLQTCVRRVFGPGSNDRIVTPKDDTYTDARIGESIQFEQFPSLIAYAKDASEVSPLLLCAKRTGHKAVPRTGAHHFLGYSALNDSLVIDISHIDYVNIAADKNSAQVGAGIRFGPLYTALAAQGRDWPGGICPTVGLSGFLGAGGFNMQMRQIGLGVDHVLAARVVLADGKVVTASPQENPDLFWAIRGGGGGTFGIVVEWTLKLSAFPRSAMILINWKEPNTTVQVANRWHAWAPYADKTLTTQLNIYTNRSQLVGWCYGCTVQQAQSLVNSSGILAIGKPEVFITGNCNSANSRMIGFVVNECMPDDKVAELAP
ncbi:FAD-linked oxidoreductase pytB [Cladobotryum mycophilum]|uniref:FAD-linked oxidoreductase pytB n=1 Tax=Cladobotryum mycophilum TaxID=491253 RepID=A0ABR0S5T4_9HYPO